MLGGVSVTGVGVAWLTLIIATLAYGGASLLQARAAQGAHGKAVLKPGYVLGLVLDGAAWLLSLVALARLPLFVVQAVLAGSLAVTAVLARLVLGVRLRRAEGVAVGMLVLALAVLAGTAGVEAASSPGRLITGLLVGGAPALALVSLLGRAGRASRLAVLAGLGFSGAALCARATHGTPSHLLVEPLVYALLAYGAVGAWAYGVALERGHVTGVTATLWGVEVAVPAVVGVVLLGDTVRADAWPYAVLALLVVLGAVRVLAGAGQDPAAGARDAASRRKPSSRPTAGS